MLPHYALKTGPGARFQMFMNSPDLNGYAQEPGQGVKFSEVAMAVLETQVGRLLQLEKWFVDIRPHTGAG